MPRFCPQSVVAVAQRVCRPPIAILVHLSSILFFCSSLSILPYSSNGLPILVNTGAIRHRRLCSREHSRLGGGHAALGLGWTYMYPVYT